MPRTGRGSPPGADTPFPLAGNEEPFRDTLPFLLHRLAVRVVTRGTADFAALGLTVSEARAMVVTLQLEPVRVSAIAVNTAIELSTLSHMLGRLERDKFVKRVRDAEDSRSVCVTLTPRGRTVAMRAQAAMRGHQDIMIDGMDEEHVGTLRELLRRVYENVDAAAGPPSLLAELEPKGRRSRK